jgi:hypothetical protein
MNDTIDPKIGPAVTRKLAELGDTADAVAASLVAAHCRGMRSSAYRCPVANYLRTIGWQDPDVDSVVFSIYDGAMGDKIAEGVLPVPVRRFIDDFDRGLYGDLILPFTAA